MMIHQTGEVVTIQPPAKVNLYLEVLARRADGFHDIETLIAPIAWCDTLQLVADMTGEITLDCRWATGLTGERLAACRAGRKCPYDDLPPSEDNLVCRALELLRRESGSRAGARVTLIKRIPAAAGLGGASADAAAALIAANVAWELRWSHQRLAELASKLGSDIPFFFTAAAAMCRGRGERIESVSVGGPLQMVVVKPAGGLSTAEVYRRCRPPAVACDPQPLMSALRGGDGAAVGKRLFNRLEEPAHELSADVRGLAAELESVDAWGSRMSGSGTSCFVVCRHARHARRLAAWLRVRGAGAVQRTSTAGRESCRRVADRVRT